jgi:Outer membrane protein beta-barrel domain
MEKNFYTDDFEQLLKEKSDQFRMYPSKRVWHSIYNDLHPGRKWPSVAMSMLLVIVLLLVGYLNTGDNTINNQFSGSSDEQAGITKTDPRNGKNKPKISSTNPGNRQSNGDDEKVVAGPVTDDISNVLIAGNSFLLNMDPADGSGNSLTSLNPNAASGKTSGQSSNNGNDIFQKVDTYIKTSQIFADVAVTNKKKKTRAVPTINSVSAAGDALTEDEEIDGNVAGVEKIAGSTGNDKTHIGDALILPGQNKNLKEADAIDNGTSKKDLNIKKTISAEEKAWIENYALLNRSQRRGKWKGRLAIELYIAPSVSYRTLNSSAKGSASSFANSDIDNGVSHKPGLGLEAGAGLSYSFAKNFRFNAGIQYNSTSYGINADKTSHPIQTSLLLNDVTTGYSYPNIRTSILANPRNTPALQPVTIHNTTHQVSIPIGIAYKLASTNKLDWFAGASIQPSYVFGGNAYLISSDMKDYVAEPSMMRTWNLNTGFETYINYKLGGFSLQVGPQARYQLFSTYKKKYALIEKPYAVGLRIGIVKGF